MFIQGNLQVVFDALYTMGVINPALRADWAPADKAIKRNPLRLQEVIQVVNHSGGNEKELIERLQKFDQETLLFLAMEVAREFVDFEDRTTLH
jgi:hypothetical protein